MEEQELLANGFSDGMSPLRCVPPPSLFPRLLQIYNQTDGSYMGSPEMSSLYSIVNALTQTAATITLILSVFLSYSVAFAPFSLFLSGSISASPFLFLSRTEQTGARVRARSPNAGTLKHLRSSLFFGFLIMHIILPLLVNCTK